ncbi:L,D-transpeptidase [Halomonas sp. 18H]|uniref:L,D-transpeptidase n=1 Tax=Halomonas almeriensis TaxID=308163 RepID=UPI00222FCE2D|nr:MULTISPECIES: L,D-transpeptidase [Halomonas]MCW4151193.1 L,D-transpeptidase [Halomonas sp. 18H]MDN3553073.1 L,D-transpeptidase [Halomonas almeriensis]
MRTPRLSSLPPEADTWVEIDVDAQQLTLHQGREALWSCAVSTGAAGTGELDGSGCTPLGWHYVRAAIGEGQPPGTVYRGRRPTGEVFDEHLAAAHPERDWILTRILWLCGLESGRNRGGQVDSQRRYIYLHGTPPNEPMGVPASHGCIRLRDADLLEVFQRARAGTPFWLH